MSQFLTIQIQNDVFVQHNVSVPGIDDVHISDETVSNDDSSTKHSESLTSEEETINYSEKAPDENCTVDRFTLIKGKHKEDAIFVPDEKFPVKAKVGNNSSKNKRIWRNLPNEKFLLYLRRGFLFLWVLGMGCVILLWHSLGLPYNYFSSVSVTKTVQV